MSVVADILYQGRQESLNIVDTGGSLVEVLSDRSSICPLIGSEIKFLQQLGKGGYGKVFAIEYAGMGRKEYVAKKMRAKVKVVDAKELRQYSKDATLQNAADAWRDEGIIPSIFISLNGGNPNVRLRDLNTLFIPKYADICLTTETVVYPKANKKGIIEIPKGSYVCKNEVYSEYFIGLLLGELYRNETCIHFIDTFAFATCPNYDRPKQSYQYIFMQKIDDNLFRLHRYLESKEATYLFIQTLFAIAAYQHHYKVNHNDLHAENVFIEVVNKHTKYRGHHLYDADYYRYRVGGRSIYLPAMFYIVKIGDFGQSVKWGTPVVGSRWSIINGRDHKDGEGGWVPNWYSPSYDILFLGTHLNEMFPHNKFIRNVVSFVGQFDFPESYKMMKTISKSILSGSSQYRKGRPELSTLTNVSAVDVLMNNDLMKDFYTKPTGKIVTLGII